jgi:hypothetical protein
MAEEELDHCAESKLSNKKRGPSDVKPLLPKLYVSRRRRATTLAAWVAQMIGYNMTSPINCKVSLPGFEILIGFAILTYLPPGMAGRVGLSH